MIIVLVCIFVPKSDMFSITTFKKSYNYVTTVDSENELMEVLIYLSDKNISMTNEEKIINSNIYDKNTTDTIEVKLSKITDMDFKQEIKGKGYNLFSFIFILPKISSSEEIELKMNEAILQLNLISYDINLEIGSFYYMCIKEIGSNYLSISKLKPIVNVINYNKTLVGLDMSFYNNTNKTIMINKIKVLENGIYVSNHDIKKLEKEISSNEQIDNILGYKYDYKTNDSFNDLSSNNLSLEITNINNEFIIPIKYDTDYPISSCGIMIEFIIDGKNEKLYFDDFLFFKDNELSYPSEKIIIKQYENY